MQISNLQVSKREIKGKQISKKLRRQGIIPAVVYGDGVNFSVQIEKKMFAKIISKNPSGHPILELEVTDSDFNSHVMLKDIQRDPVSDEIIHADFLKIDMTKKVTITVPIKIIGTSKGVIEEGGVLNIVYRQIDIEALPYAVPETIDIDISDLALNESIHISDIRLSDDIKILEDSGIAIVSVVPPKVEEVKEEEEEAAEGEEGAEGEGKTEEGESKADGKEETKADGKGDAKAEGKAEAKPDGAESKKEKKRDK